MKYIKFLYVIIFIAVSFFSVDAYAQSHTIGFKGGASIGFANFEPSKEMIADYENYEGSLTYTYTGFQEYYGALQVELTYAQRGYRFEHREDSDSVSIRKINSVELPFLWRPYYTFSKDRGIVYGLLGMYLYYDVSSVEINRDLKRPDSSFNTHNIYEYDSLKDNRLGIGVQGGFGFGWNLFRNFRANLEVRYIYAFSNVLRPASQWKGNPIQSTTSRVSCSFGFTYSF